MNKQYRLGYVMDLYVIATLDFHDLTFVQRRTCIIIITTLTCTIGKTAIIPGSNDGCLAYKPSNSL